MINKLKTNIKLIATDLDGTLLRNDRTISDVDWQTLIKLAERPVLRVAATGRSLYKVRQVLPVNAPFDYLIFSSGAGIYDWRNQQLLQSEHFDKQVSDQLCNYLLISNLNFFVFKPIPNNNLFWYHKGAGKCAEYENYLERHQGDFEPLNTLILPVDAGQMMAVIPNDETLFEKLKNEIYEACSRVKVIRATSPVNPDFIWLEIFPETVSKGHGIKWLCDSLNIDRINTVGIGNDYNDADMFEYVAHPYVLSNGVDALKKHYCSVNFSNNENGFTSVVEQVLK